jgi:hypothetical protein
MIKGDIYRELEGSRNPQVESLRYADAWFAALEL